MIDKINQALWLVATVLLIGGGIYFTFRLSFVQLRFKTMFRSFKTKENVGKIIQELKNEGHKIIIITARHEEEIDDPYTLSKEWLEKNNIYFDYLFYRYLKYFLCLVLD